jgi:hypothetical protein
MGEVNKMSEKNNEKASAEEAYAYTPGLKVKRAISVEKTRLLPIPGEVLVQEKDAVDFDTIVARAEVPGKPTFIRVNEVLNIEPDTVKTFMVKTVGDEVDEGEIIARYTPFWGLIKRFARAPATGTIEAISDATGQVVVREPPVPVTIKAYISGSVAEVIPERGVGIETPAAFIQGIFGIGGEKHGELLVVAESKDDVLTPEKMSPDHEGKIVVGGSLVTLEAFKKAQELGVNGIIVGGIKGVDLREILGYEIGVAITGHEDVATTLVVTEGFGMMSISKSTFDLLRDFEGQEVAINGATQIRAGVIRPEIIVPQKRYKQDIDDESLARGMRPGTPVRIIREPYFGKIGTVVSLPVHLQKVQTESLVRVLEVELEEGKVIVPRANVEIIEE